MTTMLGEETAITTTDLHVAYRSSISALRGVDIVVPSGRVVALLGANGAGKTTLLRAISGLLPTYGGAVTQGRIEISGVSHRRLTPTNVVRGGVAQALEGRRLFHNLTVEENILTGAATLPATKRRAKVAELMDRFPLLSQRRNTRAGLLSGGQQQVVAIARALAAAPRVLLLDEPSLGLSPIAVQSVQELLTSMKQDGMTILLVEQNLNLALAVCDHFYVLQRGVIEFDGDRDTFVAGSAASELYLGSQAAEYDGGRPARTQRTSFTELPWMR